jgi:hypothetical protein
MVRVRTIKTKADCQKRGLHLMKPTESQIQAAKEDAAAKGFRTIWIHKKKGF